MKKILLALCLSIAFSSMPVHADWPTYKKLDDRTLIYRSEPFIGFIGVGALAFCTLLSPIDDSINADRDTLRRLCFFVPCTLLAAYNLTKKTLKKHSPILVLDKNGFEFEGHDRIEWSSVDGIFFRINHYSGYTFGHIEIATRDGIIKIGISKLAIKPDLLRLLLKEYDIKVYSPR